MSRIILTDQCVSPKCTKQLALLGFDVVRLPSFRGISEPVSSHPDMLIWPLGDGEILTFERYFTQNREFFEGLGVRVLTTDEPVGKEYPHDVLLNVLDMGGCIYGKLEYASRVIRLRAKREVNVAQGYARCSTLKVSDNAAITSDPSIADALSRNGCDVLRIAPGSIELPPYEYGFIGGSAVLLSKHMCAFFGDFTKHPDADKMEDFMYSHGVDAMALSDEPLSDHGGAVII